MTGSEHGTAVLIRQGRGLECVYFSGNLDYLGLVHAYERTEYRYAADRVRAGDSRHGLTCYLSDALAGDECETVVLFGDALSDLHHQAAHDYREEFLGAVVLDSLLKLRERHAVERDAAAPVRELFAELLDFELCAVGGIGRAYIVYRRDVNSPLSHHPARNRTVDAA